MFITTKDTGRCAAIQDCAPGGQIYVLKNFANPKQKPSNDEVIAMVDTVIPRVFGLMAVQRVLVGHVDSKAVTAAAVTGTLKVVRRVCLM